MTRHDTVEALDRWVERIAGLGAAVVERLRPGASPQHVAAAADRHGFVLPPEVAAIWSWHDGERVGSDVGTPRDLPGLIPDGAFYDLDATLHLTRTRWHAVCGDDEALADPATPPDYAQALWRPEWVVLDFWLLPLVLAPTPDGCLDTFRYDPQSGPAWVAHSSLPERVERWHRCLDVGAWQVRDDGTWAVDASRLPGPDPAAPREERVRITEVL